MRVHPAIPVLIVVVTTIVAVGFALSSVRAGGGSRPLASQAAAMDMSNELHVLQGGFWRTDGGFVSTIRIKNVLVVAPIQVSPTLFMADGTAYPLAPVSVATAGVATVDINEALASAPPAVSSHVSQFGSLMLTYTYPTPGHVVATMASIDTPRSLSYVYMINEPMPMPEDNMPKALEGLWWKHDRNVHGIISLANTTDQQRTATVRIVRGNQDSDARQVQLAPRATEVLSLEQISREASDENNRAGGVRVEYSGPSGAVMVSGSLANENIGYSANMVFWPHDVTNGPAQKIEVASPGIMVGKPDPMMMPGFPADTRFIPYLSMRNTTASRLDVTLALNYMNGSTPITRSLPSQKLHPFEARSIDLEGMLHSAGLRPFDGNFNLSISYTGHPGDLAFANGSVDQTGTYVFEVRPQGISDSIGRITGYWSVDKGSDAMFSLWNPTDQVQNILATIYYGDGSGIFRLPIHLAPQASTTLDIAMLIMDRTQDRDGKVIPQNVKQGSASFDSADADVNAYDGRKRTTTVISGGVFNVTEATCGLVCTYCNGYNNFRLSPSSPFLLVGDGIQLQAQATDSYGNTQVLSGGSWSSSNTATFSISGGLITAVGAGTSNIVDQFYNVIVYQGNFCTYDSQNTSCPVSNPAASTTATAAPKLTSISPAQGPNGITTAVTLAGNGFGSSCSNVTISAGSSITVTCSSVTNTQIQASFAVSASASGGNQSVSVKVNSQTSPTVNFFIQIPSSLSIVSGTDSTTTEALCTFVVNGTTYTGCGVTRSFTYQVNDQRSPAQPIQAAGMQVWDSFGTVSPNPLNIGGFNTTCTPANTGPCGIATNSSGQFLEMALSVCSTVCRSNGVCVTGGPSVVGQTYHVGTGTITQTISYYCQRVLVNGQ